MGKNELPWIEKYRPKLFSEILYQKQIIETLKKNINKLPHLIFYGQSGTGKTSLIICIAKHLYGNTMKQNTLILNASDERGINTVRNKIKTFAQKSIYNNKNKFKLIILDEADSMTPDAQTALRRIMEKYSKTTRFCFICNYDSKIIEPISSRCSKFRFKKIDDKIIQNKLIDICKKEGMENYNVYIPLISNYSKGDMRQSIILLETINKLSYGKNIDQKIIFEILEIIDPDYIEKIIEECTSFQNIQKLTQDIIKEGYSISKIFNKIAKYIINTDKFSDKNKSKLFLELSKHDKMIHQNSDNYFQLSSFLCKIMEIKNNL